MPEKNPWKINHTAEIYDNPWIRVVEHQVTNPAGKPGIYGVVHFKNTAVAVIPVDEDGYTWLVGQYRFPTGTYEWEVPEGGAPADEDPEACARRELAEETGLLAKELRPILEMQLSNSTTNERSISYLATGITHGQASPEDTEKLAVRRLPLVEAIAMARRNEIRDALSVASLLQLDALRRDPTSGLPACISRGV
ncbi:MAG: NUDIX domain-containing protein [Verrucomicrobiales bacterium]